MLRSPRCPVRRRVGSRASAASEAMRTSPSAHDTARTPAASPSVSVSTSVSGSRSLRSRNSASRAVVSPSRTSAPSSAGRQNSPRVQPSRLVMDAQDPFGLGTSVDPSACSGSERRTRSSWAINSCGASAAISASRAAGTRRAMRTMASSPSRPGEQREAGGQLVDPAGDAHQARGPAVGDTGLPGEPVLGRADAAPCQPSAASRSTTAATSRATAGLTVPIASAAAASATRHARSCGPAARARQAAGREHRPRTCP